MVINIFFLEIYFFFFLENKDYILKLWTYYRKIPKQKKNVYEFGDNQPETEKIGRRC